MRSRSPNAVAVQLVNATGGPECDEPKRVEFDPARVCAPQFHLDHERGIAGSYGRRVWGVTKEDGINLRIGPEFVAAKASGRRLLAPQGTYPAEVSEWFAAALLRLDGYEEGPSRRARDHVFKRFAGSVGGGLAVAGYREGDVLIDGSPNASRQSDVVVGPVVNFGLGFWITRDVVVRGDLYGMFAKPHLSFPWRRVPAFAGIGVVKVF